jgi:hypothetical protein
VFVSRGVDPSAVTTCSPKVFAWRGGLRPTTVRRTLAGAVFVHVSVCDECLRPVQPFVVVDVPRDAAVQRVDV